MGFFFVSFIIFSAAFLAAGYYVYRVPQQQAADVLGSRLRELRARNGVRPSGRGDLVRGARLAKFEHQLPESIDLFNRSMKAGHNIQSGLETISTEAADPVKQEFKKLMEEMSLGSTLDAALHNLGERIPIIDLKFFITGLILQRQTGANMVSVLENLSTLVRERLALQEKMKAATAQQRWSAALLCGMPIFFAMALWVMKPEYIDILVNDEVGSKFFAYAVISETLGILVIRKLSSPKI